MDETRYDVSKVGTGRWKKFDDPAPAYTFLRQRLERQEGPYHIRKGGGDWGPWRPLDKTMDQLHKQVSTNDPGLKLVLTGREVSAPNWAFRKTIEPPKTGSLIVKLAVEQLGDDYSWGAEGPTAFDCSGFTKFCYEHAADTYLPHSAYEQYHSTVVQFHDETKLVPGDLLFYDASTRPSPNHVGIYYGIRDGRRKVIDASSSADQIVLRDWDLNPLIGYGYLPSVTGSH